MGCSDTVAVTACPAGGEMLALSLCPGIVTIIATVVIAINAIFIELWFTHTFRQIGKHFMWIVFIFSNNLTKVATIIFTVFHLQKECV